MSRSLASRAFYFSPALPRIVGELPSTESGKVQNKIGERRDDGTWDREATRAPAPMTSAVTTPVMPHVFPTVLACYAAGDAARTHGARCGEER